MPQLKVDSITNRSDNAPPELSQGATIPSGKTISNSGGMVVNGTLTGTFSGDGSAIVTSTPPRRPFSIKLIIDPLPFRS